MEDRPGVRRYGGRGGGQSEAGPQPGHGAGEEPFRTPQHFLACGEVALRPQLSGVLGAGQGELPGGELRYEVGTDDGDPERLTGCPAERCRAEGGEYQVGSARHGLRHSVGEPVRVRPRQRPAFLPRRGTGPAPDQLLRVSRHGPVIETAPADECGEGRVSGYGDLMARVQQAPPQAGEGRDVSS
ncbi:hypothetical protein GCM10010327_11450 [Streptomyces nitrosporeus]|nr:hypothetical protein GCM10010327_11450 [Streptomyces nitrosporeus]